MCHRWISAPAFVVFLMLGGCASYDQKHVEYGASQLYANSVTLNGVTLAAEPYDTETEVVEAFDENLLKKDYYPIKVLVENNSESRVMIFRQSVQLTDQSGYGYRPVDASVMAEDFEDNKMAYALLGFGIFSYMSAAEANDERSADYQAKNMAETQIVLPGQSRGAFLYFKLPQGTDLNASSLSLDVEHLETNKISQFELPLSQMYAGPESGSASATVAAAQPDGQVPAPDRPDFDGVWMLTISDTEAPNDSHLVRVVVANSRFSASFETNGWSGTLSGEINEFGTLTARGTASKMGWGMQNLGIKFASHYRSNGFEEVVTAKGRVKATFKVSFLRNAAPG